MKQVELFERVMRMTAPTVPTVSVPFDRTLLIIIFIVDEIIY